MIICSYDYRKSGLKGTLLIFCRRLPLVVGWPMIGQMRWLVITSGSCKFRLGSGRRAAMILSMLISGASSFCGEVRGIPAKTLRWRFLGGSFTSTPSFFFLLRRTTFCLSPTGPKARAARSKSGFRISVGQHTWGY